MAQHDAYPAAGRDPDGRQPITGPHSIGPHSDEGHGHADMSNDEEMITAIDDNTGEIYPIEKLRAHRQNVPHLAVSVFLFCHDSLLLQQRANGKYHSGGQWANTCCSHPRWNESLPHCAVRRLREETGFSVPLQNFGIITYRARVGCLWENEQAHCFAGVLPDLSLPTGFNPAEVQAMSWVPLSQLRDLTCSAPEHYAPWLRIYLQEHFELLASALEAA